MQYSVTVIIPVYNGMPFLPETVDSILQQTYEDFRLLIVDDGSTDDSFTYLQSLTDQRIEIRQQRNLGFGKSLNRAVESVDSDFIVHLDQDDVALPTRLQEQLDFLSSHQEYGFVLSNVSKISSMGMEFGGYVINDAELISNYESVKYGAISPSTLCFRRQAFLELGGYRPSLYPVDDYDLLLRAEENYGIAVINKPLVKYRVHSKSASFKKFYEMQFKTRYIETLASMRRSGQLEISLEEFTKKTKGSFLEKMNEYRRSLGKLNFRKAGCLIGEKNYIYGTFSLLYAYLLTPSFVSKRLSSLRKI
jgi:glycosyltransferase involved in cell wall biosynthesis